MPAGHHSACFGDTSDTALGHWDLRSGLRLPRRTRAATVTPEVDFIKHSTPRSLPQQNPNAKQSKMHPPNCVSKTKPMHSGPSGVRGGTCVYLPGWASGACSCRHLEMTSESLTAAPMVTGAWQSLHRTLCTRAHASPSCFHLPSSCLLRSCRGGCPAY